MARRAGTVSSRVRISLTRATFGLWDEAVQAVVRADCHRISEEIDSAAQAVKARQAEWNNLELAAEESEAARLDLLEELHRREAEAVATEAQVQELRQQSAELLEQLEAEREMPLHTEVASLRASLTARQLHRDPDLSSLEAQLVEAIEVQGSLRFSLRRSQAEAELALEARAAAQTKAAELRTRLEEARASYIYAIDALDRKVAGLEREGLEAESMALRLEQALENTAFKMRMADVELQRWLT